MVKRSNGQFIVKAKIIACKLCVNIPLNRKVFNQFTNFIRQQKHNFHKTREQHDKTR